MMDKGQNIAGTSNFRSADITVPTLIPSTSIGGADGMSDRGLEGAILRTPYAGNVRALAPPPLPQLPYQQNLSGYAANSGGYGFGNTGFGNFGGFGYGGGFNGFSGLGGYGSYGSYGGFGYNRFGGATGVNPNDPESRFIQLAEASSRPAFQSIESLVMAIGNIAAMLDSTFFALTSSFRAILGVAANFGRLRSVFGQFWSTFAIFRGLNWIYRKILYWLRLSNLDPSSQAFKQAFSEALTDINCQNTSSTSGTKRKGQSPWPVLAFLSFIFAAPYLIMKLLGTVSNTAQDEARNPSKWVSPIRTIAVYDFQARSASELSVRAGNDVLVAPREIQQTVGLLSSGWALATLDGQQSGIIPINYVKLPQQMQQERLQQDERVSALKQPQIDVPAAVHSEVINPQPALMNLSPAAFAALPNLTTQDVELIPDLEIAPQPIGPPTTQMVALAEGFA